MAKKTKKPKKESKQKNNKKKENKQKKKVFTPVLVFVLLALSLVAIAITIIVIIGMLPTMVAAAVDKTKKKAKVMCVGSLNSAFCVPYVLKILENDSTIDFSLSLISDPLTIVVMYTGAALGYMIDWILTNFTKKYMTQKAHNRLKAIKAQQDEMIKRWGFKVTGDLPLDKHGFPLEEPEAEKA